jgi:KipI family sensor histidine kinase inhibitor
MHKPRFLLAGDAALVIEFDNEINPDVNRKVHRLAYALERNPFPGLGEAVPSYRSLLVHYNPLRLSSKEVEAFVSETLRQCEETPPLEPRLVEIPTVYGGEFGPDIEFVAWYRCLSIEKVVQFHSEAIYTVYMLGFSPGFPYLGVLPEAISTPRLSTPRKSVPAGSVGIAGRQTGIYPISTPGGWQLIGRTPVTLFDPWREPPALLKPGDRVRFVPISAEEFEVLVKEGADSA